MPGMNSPQKPNPSPSSNQKMPVSSPRTVLLTADCPSNAGYEALLPPRLSLKPNEEYVKRLKELKSPRMGCSSPTEISGSCYVFLFLALSVLELIKWMICISRPALLLLPCSARMRTNCLSSVFPPTKHPSYVIKKDAILLQG